MMKYNNQRTNEQIVNSEEFANLRKMAEEYIESLEKDDHVDDDLDHFIFEGVMELFYGKEIWDYINKLSK